MIVFSSLYFLNFLFLGKIFSRNLLQVENVEMIWWFFFWFRWRRIGLLIFSPFIILKGNGNK